MIDVTKDEADRIQKIVQYATFFVGYDEKEYLLAGGQIFLINKRPKKKDKDGD